MQKNSSHASVKLSDVLINYFLSMLFLARKFCSVYLKAIYFRQAICKITKLDSILRILWSVSPAFFFRLN